MDQLSRPPTQAPHIPLDELTGFSTSNFKYMPTDRDSKETAGLKEKFNISNRRQTGVPISEPAVSSWNPMVSIGDALTVSNSPSLIEASAKKDYESWASKRL